MSNDNGSWKSKALKLGPLANGYSSDGRQDYPEKFQIYLSGGEIPDYVLSKLKREGVVDPQGVITPLGSVVLARIMETESTIEAWKQVLEGKLCRERR